MKIMWDLENRICNITVKSGKKAMIMARSTLLKRIKRWQEGVDLFLYSLQTDRLPLLFETLATYLCFPLFDILLNLLQTDAMLSVLKDRSILDEETRARACR
jgi:hypothetical protein